MVVDTAVLMMFANNVVLDLLWLLLITHVLLVLLPIAEFATPQLPIVMNVSMDFGDIILVNVDHILALKPTVKHVGGMTYVESVTFDILQFMVIAFPAILPIAKHAKIKIMFVQNVCLDMV